MTGLLVANVPRQEEPREPPKKKAKILDPRVAAIMDAIDVVRRDYGYSNWDDLAAKAGIAPSTLSAWRSGETTPDYVLLDDVTKVVGLSVGLVLDSDTQAALLRGVRYMPSDLAQTIALLVDRLETDKQKLEALSEVRKVVQKYVSGSRPPPRGDGA